MKVIHLQTHIAAAREICFDLSRSVEVHLTSTAHTGERAIAGRTTGLCLAGDKITWRAKHLGVVQHLTVQITQMEYPSHFQDRMVKGAFKYFTHDHYFEQESSGTLMRDVFAFAAPLGVLGILAENLFLERYMRKLLLRRNEVIKQFAESGNWQDVLIKNTSNA